VTVNEMHAIIVNSAW